MEFKMMRTNRFIIYVFIIFSFGVYGQELTKRQITAYLLDQERYDSNTVPNFDKEYPLNVSIQITIHDMHSVSESNMEYSLDIYLRMWWRDERLDFSRNSSIAKLELDSKQLDAVWQPDIFFENEKRASVHTVTTTNKLIHIFNNGTVIYSVRLSLALTCTMLLHYYPFDSQRCPIYMQSFGYTTDNIDLHWHKHQAIVFEHIEMPQFTLDRESIITNDFHLPYSGTGTFSTLEAKLVLNRKVGFYFLQVFVPSILLVVLSWVSFWVDPNAVPARVSLGVTCVLTMTTQSSGIRQSLPPVSYVKAIDVWMFVCLLFVFAALLEFAYVNVMQRKKSKKQTKHEAGDENVQMDSPKAQDKKGDKSCIRILISKFKTKHADGQTAAKKVDYIARIMFPLSFILFLTTFFIVCGLSPSQTTSSS